MANSNTFARADAAKSKTGAKVVVLDAAGDFGHIPVNSLVGLSSQDLAGSSAIDVTAAEYFIKTISANTTFTLSNVPDPGVVSFIMEITNGGAYAITWWAGTKWDNGTAPTLTAAGKDVLGFVIRNGATVGTVLALNVS